MMGNTQQPTRHTRHMDTSIKKFVIIDWIERDMLIIKHISTTDNFADLPMVQQLHYRPFERDPC